MKLSAENLGSAEPQDLLFFLHGILSSAVATLWPPFCLGGPSPEPAPFRKHGLEKAGRMPPSPALPPGPLRIRMVLPSADVAPQSRLLVEEPSFLSLSDFCVWDSLLTCL